MQNKHREFLEKIKIKPEYQTKKANTKSDGYERENTQEEINLQKELERRFDELLDQRTNKIYG